MANLHLINRLNNKYKKSSRLTQYVNRNRSTLNEAFNKNAIRKTHRFSIQNISPAYEECFVNGEAVEVVVMYIDVCNFSTRFEDLSGSEIGQYFDEYYDKVIPIIYKNGGEIDKIMGDGIICVFGAPFQNESIDKNIASAYQCAKDIIKKTKDTDYSSKVALHSGEVNYFKNKTGLYEEYTMVGKPLTELFRLESISEGETINCYGESKIRKQYEEDMKSIYQARMTLDKIRFQGVRQAPSHYMNIKEVWKWRQQKIENLKGVDFKYRSYLKLTYEFN